MNQKHLTKSERAKYKALREKRQLATRGTYRPKFEVYVPKQVWRPDEPHIPSLNQVPAGCVGTPTIMDNLHKESPEVQQAIIAKSKQLAPAYNKGPYSLIVVSELTTMGRKN